MASAFSATRWVLVGSFGFRVLAYVGQMIILRLVAKEIFGAYGSLIDIHMMLLPLLPLGIDSLLVREKRRRRRYVIALSQILAFFGLLMAAISLLAVLLPTAGPESFAGILVEQGATYHAVLFMAPIFAVMATKLSVRSLHAAELNFRTISLGEFGNGLITYFGGAAAVFLAPSAWALMAAYLAGELFECVYIYRRQPFRPLAVLEPRRWRMLRTIYLRHRKFCLTNTADLTLNNIGSLLPGPMILALIGAAAAADFRVARLLIQLPVMLLVGSIWRVAYPTLTGVSDEVLHHRCLRIIGTTAAFIAPVVIWLGFFAPATAWLLGGEKYLNAAPLIAWMAAYMILVAVFSPISSLDMVRDKPEVGLYWNLVHTLARIAIIWYFAPLGLLATIAAMSIMSGILWIVWAAMLGSLLGAPAAKYAGAVLKFLPLWIALAVAFHACNLLTKHHLLLPVALSVIPAAVYTYAIWRYFPGETQMARRLLGRDK